MARRALKPIRFVPRGTRLRPCLQQTKTKSCTVRQLAKAPMARGSHDLHQMFARTTALRRDTSRVLQRIYEMKLTAHSTRTEQASTSSNNGAQTRGSMRERITRKLTGQFNEPAVYRLLLPVRAVCYITRRANSRKCAVKINHAPFKKRLANSI